MNIIKPRLRKYNNGWLCKTPFINATGKTPEEAYSKWCHYFGRSPLTGSQFKGLYLKLNAT